MGAQKIQPHSARPKIFPSLKCASWLLAGILLLISFSVVAQTNFAVLTSDGAWTWFNDPRAVFHNGTLYFGYVRNGDGRSALSAFNLPSGQTTNLWSSSLTQVDDHDVCGLLVKQDQTMLAIYSRHQNDQFFTYRLSTSTNPISPAVWGAEQTDNTGTSVSSGMTYANPFQLTNESGKIYNFARYLNYNPNVFTSTDGGATWSTPQTVIQTGNGSTRPYVKYCSDYGSRMDLLYTDAHPDNFPTSLYHTYYSGGAFYQTDGTFLKSYASLPILHDSGERGTVVYQYSEAAQSDPNQWIPFARAWCWEIAYQTNGQPACVFQGKVDSVTGPNWFDARVYYYYSRWTGTNWQKRFIAQGGRPLYDGQPDYGGGMALDPQDVNTIYISTDAANPFDLTTTANVPLGNHYEIWKGITSDGGLTFSWQAVTTNSTVDNLRPYVPRRFGGEPCVLWFRGNYVSYTSFNSAIVGLFTTPVPQTNGASSTWTADADGVWSDNTKWQNGIVGAGAGNTADFSTLDISGDRTVTLDSPRTLGFLRFGDTAGSQNWFLNSSSGAGLRMSPGVGISSFPGVVVNNNTVTLQISLAGTNGLTKSGPGTLVLSASNGLSGPLNLDSGSTSANDGAVRLTTSAAVANVASPITFRNNTGAQAVGSLQMDGSSGGIIVTQNFSTACRNNNTVPTFESLAGTNTLAGTNFVQVGGTNVIYQSDAGSLLQLTAPVQYVGTLTAGRTFSFTGAGDFVVGGALLAATNAAPIGVIKSGGGVLSLNGVNTYTNGTIILGGALQVNGSLATGHVDVNAASLGGVGNIAGPVTISPSATLAPGGSAIGTLTINNSLTNNGLTAVRLGKTGSALTNDNIKGLVTCLLGGTLSFTNIGPGIITVGDSFKLVSASNYRVFFSNLVPAAPGTNLLWNTNNLAVNGTLSVTLGNVNPQFGQVFLAGTNLVVSGTGGAAGYGFSILSSTNLMLPLTAWTVLDAGICDRFGAFKITNSLSPNSPQLFYALRIP